METSVTKPIEEAVNQVAGIDGLRSTTKEGISTVVIQFKLEKDGAIAAQEVDAKVRTILSQLPEGTDSPIIDKLAIDAAPVLTLAVSGRRDQREITEIAKKRIKEDLETIYGVGSVVLVGGRQRAVNVVLDPDRLLKYENLTVEDIRQRRSARIRNSRAVDRGNRSWYCTSGGSSGATSKLIVGNRGGQPIRIETWAASIPMRNRAA
jgi:HAE1 family hydrophobic/amphiphilic exporter-1